jgi:hypothetical protein
MIAILKLYWKDTAFSRGMITGEVKTPDQE